MLNKLFTLVEKENILFSFCPMSDKLFGFYSRTYSPPVILLSNKLKNNLTLQKVILAEELGHHFTISCMRHYSDASIFAKLQIKDRIEHKAFWWAVQYLVPFESFVEAVNSGLTLTYELAEHFDVTERFMGISIRLYQQKKKEQMDKLLKYKLQELFKLQELL